MSRKKNIKPAIPEMDLTEADLDQLDAPPAPEKKGKLKAVKPVKAIDIRAATLKGIFCTYSYDHVLADGVTNRMECKKSEVPVHEDLDKAFNKLNAHLAVISERVEVESIRNVEDIEEYDPELHEEKGLQHLVSRFVVNAIRLEGTDEKEGVVLLGAMLLSDGESMKLETPKKTWEGDYPFINELRVAVMDLIAEVEMYAKGEKRAAEQQAQIPYPENNSEDYGEVGR